MTSSPLPPGPSLRWFGIPLARAFARDPLGFTCEMVRAYGPLVRLQFGPVNAFLVADPGAIHQVLAGDAKRYRKEPRGIRAVAALDGRSLITTEGDYWLGQRRFLQRGFTPPRMERFARVIAEATERMLATWPERQEIEICGAMNQLALEIIGRALFDVDLSRQAPGLAESAEVVSEAIVEELGGALPLPDWFPTAAKRKKRAALRAVDEAMWGLIRERKRELGSNSVPVPSPSWGGLGRGANVVGNAITPPPAPPHRGEGSGMNESRNDASDLLTMMLRAAAEEAGVRKLSDQQVRDEAVTLLVAGYDTTAAGLAWTLHLLAEHPEIAERVRAEAQAVLGARPPTLVDYDALVFTRQVIEESLRLYPPAWILMLRQACEPAELSGCRIPRGSWLYIIPWMTHRSERWFPDPERFDPERFSPERRGEIPPHAYLPFGDGPHACIGERLALLEMTLVTASVLRRFHVTPSPNQGPIVVEAHTAIRPRGGLRLCVARH